MIPLPIIVRTADVLHLTAEKGNTAEIGKPTTEVTKEAPGAVDALVNAPTDLAAWERTLNSLTESVTREILNFASTWTFIQIAIIAVAFLAALGLARLLEPRLEARLRRIHNQPRLLRALIVPLRRLKWIVFALLLWAVLVAMRAWTWPSRSYLIGVAASLAAAWVVISILSRLIRNRSLANMFAVAAWGAVALILVGLADDFVGMLDAIALPMGEHRISLLLVAKGLLLLAVFLWAASFFSDLLEGQFGSRLDISPTARVLMGKAIKGIAFTIAVLASLSLVGIDLTALAVFSGALGIGIGIGLQKLASNLLSGVIILLDRSIKPGDVITVGKTYGSISSLNARYVSVVARDGVEYLVPNETFITEPVVNWSFTDSFVRIEVRFGVSYESDPHEVRRIAVDALKNVARVQSVKPAVCHITGFGDSSIDFTLRFWIEDPQEGMANVRGNVYLALWDAFKANGINIPFPHREVILKQPAGQAQLPKGSSLEEPSPGDTRGKGRPES